MQDPKFFRTLVDADTSSWTAQALYIMAHGVADVVGVHQSTVQNQNLFRKMKACYPRGRMGKLLRLGKFKVNK